MPENDQGKKIVNFSDYHSIIETISKSIIFIGGACYVLGIIIVNTYLGTYGLVCLNLFKSIYLFAGFWCVLFLYINLIFSLGYYFRFYQNKKFRARYLLFLLIPIFTNILILSTIIVRLADYRLYLVFIFLNIVSSAVFIYFVYIAADVFHIAINELRHLLNPDTVYTFSMALVVFVAMMKIFTLEIYPHIKNEYGGGELKTVIIIPKDNSYDALEVSGIKLFPNDTMSTSQHYSEPTTLLFKSDDEYYFLVNDYLNNNTEKKHAVAIRCDLIQAISFFDKVNTSR